MSHFINNEWIEGQGPDLVSFNPATGQPCWQGRHATKQDVDAAIQAARSATESWADMPIEKRIELLRTFAQKLKTHQNDLAEAISIETGKPRWDSLTEVAAMIAKVPSTIDAYRDRRRETVRNLSGLRGVTRYKPFGVLVVFGPFNFPGHVPNGHIVPAMLAGNTLVFKPSELTPLVAQNTVELRAIAAELPADRILVETDSPYLAPGKFRGKRNEPSFVVETAKTVAAARGVPFDELARQTTENFFRLFSKVPA